MYVLTRRWPLTPRPFADSTSRLKQHVCDANLFQERYKLLKTQIIIQVLWYRNTVLVLVWISLMEFHPHGFLLDDDHIFVPDIEDKEMPWWLGLTFIGGAEDQNNLDHLLHQCIFDKMFTFSSDFAVRIRLIYNDYSEIVNPLGTFCIWERVCFGFWWYAMLSK